MEMNINLEGEDFKNKILNLITESKLPGIVVYYIIKDINAEVDSQYKILIANQKIQQDLLLLKTTLKIKMRVAAKADHPLFLA